MAKRKQTPSPDEDKVDVQEQPEAAPQDTKEATSLPQTEEKTTDAEAATETSDDSTFPAVKEAHHDQKEV